MSKVYKVDLNINVDKLHPSCGFLMKEMPKEVDPNNPDAEFDARGFKERTGAEVFVLLADVAIAGANPKVSFDELKGLRKVAKDLKQAEKTGELVANKTDIEIIKSSIRGNRQWPNSDEMFDILEQIMAKLDNAKNINEEPSQDQ